MVLKSGCVATVAPVTHITSSKFDPVAVPVYRSPAMPTSKPIDEPQPDFESAMRELEALVERLEGGDLPLEESLAAFERGVLLTRACQTSLKEAEHKVEILLKRSGEPVVEDFAADDSKAADQP
jgi:exodeoxyribonuclease VII small subunit